MKLNLFRLKRWSENTLLRRPRVQERSPVFLNDDIELDLSQKRSLNGIYPWSGFPPESKESLSKGSAIGHYFSYQDPKDSTGYTYAIQLIQYEQDSELIPEYYCEKDLGSLSFNFEDGTVVSEPYPYLL